MFKQLTHIIHGRTGLVLLGSVLLLQACGGGDDPAASQETGYAVSTSAGMGGAISPTSKTVPAGETTTFTVTPEVGYQIDNVSGCDGRLTNNSYVTGDINQNCRVSASFTLINFTVDTGLVLGGSISPAGSQNLAYGSTTSFTITPDAGFSIDSVSGCDGSLTGNTYATGAITRDCTVNVTMHQDLYRVTDNKPTGGTVGPYTPLVMPGDILNITLTPDPSYDIDSVTGCDGSLSGSLPPYTYTTSTINADCTIDVKFSPLYTVGATEGSSGTLGSVAPSSQIVMEGRTATITYTPKPTYGVVEATGCNGRLVGNTYVTGPISGDCTVNANFAALLTDAVTPRFPVNGANWNDYVEGADAASATDTACVAASSPNCIHAGELLSLTVTGFSVCTDLLLPTPIDLTASDALGMFEWQCDDSSGNAVFYSTGLAVGKHLSGLLGFTTPGWLPNSVTVYNNGNPIGVTNSVEWWSNPVTAAGDGSVPLDVEGTVYVVNDSFQFTGGHHYTVGANKIGLVIDNDAVVTGAGDYANIIEAATVDYLWIDGGIDATYEAKGIYLDTVTYSRVDNVTVTDAKQSGIELLGSSNNRVSSIHVSANDDGLYIKDGGNNDIDGVMADDNFAGIYLDSDANRLQAVNASNNFYGLHVFQANHNRLSGLALANNTYGVYQVNGVGNHFFTASIFNNIYGYVVQNGGARNNILSGFVLANNSVYGLYVGAGPTNNVLLDITAANTNTGISYNADKGLLINAIAVNNDNIGIQISKGSDNQFAGLAVANNGTGLFLSASSNNIFSEPMKVGTNTTDCYVIAFNAGASVATNPGLDDDADPTDVSTELDIHNGECIPEGASTFVAAETIDLTDSFVGKLTVDDTTNGSDTSGMAGYPANPVSFAWTGFDNVYRTWGRDGSAFPATDNAGQWNNGTGRIWDWSLASSAVSPILDVHTLPTGDDTLTHAWSGTPNPTDDDGCDAMVSGSKWNGTDSVCETVFLQHAIEINGDDIGNDNGLCESDETCLFTPNMGSYQGHGGLSAGTFVNGVLTGITLMQYDTNGR